MSVASGQSLLKAAYDEKTKQGNNEVSVSDYSAYPGAYLMTYKWYARQGGVTLFDVNKHHILITFSSSFL